MKENKNKNSEQDPMIDALAAFRDKEIRNRIADIGRELGEEPGHRGIRKKLNWQASLAIAAVIALLFLFSWWVIKQDSLDPKQEIAGYLIPDTDLGSLEDLWEERGFAAQQHALLRSSLELYQKKQYTQALDSVQLYLSQAQAAPREGKYLLGQIFLALDDKEKSQKTLAQIPEDILSGVLYIRSQKYLALYAIEEGDLSAAKTFLEKGISFASDHQLEELEVIMFMKNLLFSLSE